MGRASRALKQVLQTYSISQNQLAVALNIDRSAVYKWFHEQREPTSETIVEITKALKQMNLEAAESFVQLYLGDILTDDSPSKTSADS
ncbi:MAG: helix-turn-helix transcriptional regulator [Cyanobacteria bacterium P01_A01_bin.17]